MVKSFKNDSLHGVVKYYNETDYSKLSVEYFCINGKYITGKEYKYSSDSSFYYFNSHFFYSPDTTYEVGFLTYDLQGNILPREIHYYDVKSIDTAFINDMIEVNVSFISPDDWDVRLELGEMDENVNFIEKPIVYEGLNQVNFSIMPKELGDNILMGKLYIVSDSIEYSERRKNEQEFIFYHEFYVREKESWWKFW